MVDDNDDPWAGVDLDPIEIGPAGQLITGPSEPTVANEAKRKALGAKVQEFRGKQAAKGPAGSLYKKIKAQTDLGLGPTPGPREIQ